MPYTYKIEEFSVDITVDEYMARFRDEKRFIELCKQCPNYGNSWGCPPFDYDTESFLRRYEYAHLMVAKIIPEDKDIPLAKTQELIRPERIRIENELLGMEQQYGGRAFAYIGRCLHCKDAICTRRCHKPCMHPEKVRPSLEAYGFDIGRTLSELFDIELLWGKNGKIPEYLTLVSGFFHNQNNFQAIHRQSKP